jgi:uncharacterized membrane-anchored protein YitT (DUF2179 family)
MEEQKNVIAEENNTPSEQQFTLPPKITKENINAVDFTPKGKAMIWVRSIILTVLSSFLIAFAAYSLIEPNNFTIGGASGIAILVNVATNGTVPQWIILLSINLPLVVLAFIFVKRRFAILSAINIGLQTTWLLVFEEVFHDSVWIEFAGNGEKIFALFLNLIAFGQIVKK